MTMDLILAIPCFVILRACGAGFTKSRVLNGFAKRNKKEMTSLYKVISMS